MLLGNCHRNGFGMDIQTDKFYSFHRSAPSLVAPYCLSSDSQNNPRLRIGAGRDYRVKAS
jgi:hypothetical protein